MKKRNAGLILSAAAMFILVLAVCAQAGAAEARELLSFLIKNKKGVSRTASAAVRLKKMEGN